MAEKSLIGQSEVFEKQLLPHLRIKSEGEGGFSYSEYIPPDPAIDEFIIAGETIIKGEAILIKPDGLAWKSSSAGSPAHAFAFSNSVAGSPVYYKRVGQVAIASPILSKGRNIWLNTPNNGVNVGINVPVLTSGIIVQRLGVALTTEIIDIQIEEEENYI